MAWNRPSNGGRANTLGSPRRGGTPRPTVRGAIAGAIVVLGAAVAAWWLWPEGETRQDAASTKRGLIKEVTPAISKKAEAEQKAPEAQKVVEAKKPSPPGITYITLPNGRRHRSRGIVTGQVARVSLASKLFEHSSDLAVASLLTIEPGEGLLGDSSDYYEDFKSEFLESLKTPIIVTKDDSEEVKLLKESVIEARKELKDRLDAGEDLTQFMRESREQMRELGLYRDEIERQVHDIIAQKDELSDQDIEDLQGAANKMLEDRGVKPIQLEATSIP